MLQEKPIKHRKVCSNIHNIVSKPKQARPNTSNVVPVCMSRALRGYLRMMADASNMTVSQFMRFVVMDAVKKWDGVHVNKRVTNAFDFGRGLVPHEGADTSDCNVSITLDLDTLEGLNKVAHASGCNRSQYLRMLIVKTLNLFNKDKDKVIKSFNRKNVRVKGE